MNNQDDDKNLTEISLPSNYGVAITDSNGEMSVTLKYPQVGLPIGTPVYFESQNKRYLVGAINSSEEDSKGIWITTKISKNILYDSNFSGDTVKKVSEEVRNRILEDISKVILGEGYSYASFYSPDFKHTQAQLVIKHIPNEE